MFLRAGMLSYIAEYTMLKERRALVIVKEGANSEKLCYWSLYRSVRLG